MAKRGAVGARERAREAMATYEAKRAAAKREEEDALSTYFGGVEAEDSARALIEEAIVTQTQAVQQLRDLGKSVEEIAEKCGISVSDVRSMTRTKKIDTGETATGGVTHHEARTSEAGATPSDDSAAA